MEHFEEMAKFNYNQNTFNANVNYRDFIYRILFTILFRIKKK